MLLRIENIKKSFPIDDSIFFKKKQEVLKGVSFEIFEGECLGILGESGSGKSTLGNIVIGLETQDSGNIVFSDALQAVQRNQAVSVVFQDYTTSVNPRLKVSEIISEPIINSGLNSSEITEKVKALLLEVGLLPELVDRFPHELSGGQLQRVCIARAIAPNPKFILCDEAVSSLDISVQVQILDLLLRLKQERKLSYLFITHDIAVATYMCDRLLIFNEGRVVETLEDMSELSNVQNDYTSNLLDAAGYLELPFKEAHRG